MSVKAPAKGHTAKHTTAKKHHAAKKHVPAKTKTPVTAHAKGPQVHTVAKHPAHPKPRGYAVGELLPVCAFEAVAMWLRLQGQRVTGDDVAGLWELYGEVTVPDAAEAFGLSVRRASGTPVRLLGVDVPGPHAVLATADGWWSWGELFDPWPCRIEEAWAVSWS